MDKIAEHVVRNQTADGEYICILGVKGDPDKPMELEPMISVQDSLTGPVYDYRAPVRIKVKPEQPMTTEQRALLILLTLAVVLVYGVVIGFVLRGLTHGN